MRYDLTSRQKEWQRVATKIAREVLAPRAAEIDREGRFPRENFAVLHDAGLLALPIREEHGGVGADVLTTTIVSEALATGCASTALCYHMHVAAASLVSALAEGDQVAAFVEPILSRGAIHTYALSEPGSGSRWWHMDGFAAKDGSAYVLDVYKSFATSAGHADFYLVPVRATPESPHDELSIFVVPGETEHVSPIGRWDSMGMRGNSSTPVHFDKCRVDERSRLGEAAFGFPLLMAHGLPTFLVGLSSVYVGLAQAALDFAVSHVTKRVHADTGLPLAKVETVQRYVAEMKMRLDPVRLYVYTAARYIDQMTAEHEDLVKLLEDEDFLQSIGQVKVLANQAAVEVTDRTVQLCGGTGYSRSHPVERYYRDARAGSIMGPNDDSLRLIVGQRVLGLPFPWE